MANFPRKRPVMRGMAVPVEADPVADPVVTYGIGPASINFLTNEDRWGRITFETLDSIRICRGEHYPYEVDRKPADPIYWVHTIAPSPWLHERYEYEKRFYGAAYMFGRDVEEMRQNFSHFLFSFHDQFVEVLCDGIWFETADEYIGNREPDSQHPLLDLPASYVDHRFVAHGISCQVRRNPRPIDDLIADATLCSQKLYQFAAELEGHASVDWTLILRVREGNLRAYLTSYFGKVEESYRTIPTLDDVRPRIEDWLHEVRERRRQMGRA